jgi:hypothetical protein
MVELFAAVAFFDGPRTGRSGFTRRQVKAPHAGQVERVAKRPRTPWTGLRTVLIKHSASPALIDGGLIEQSSTRDFRIAPARFAGRRIASDRTSGLLVSPESEPD